MDERTQNLERLAAARARLFVAIANLDETTLCHARISGPWTIKDIFGHLVSWSRELRADIGAILHGRHPGADRQISSQDDYAAWNERQARLKSDWPWERILADFEQDYAEAVALIDKLQPGDWHLRGITPWQASAGTVGEAPPRQDMDSVKTLVGYHWRHMNEHAEEIEQWRRQGGPAGN